MSLAIDFSLDKLIHAGIIVFLFVPLFCADVASGVEIGGLRVLNNYYQHLRLQLCWGVPLNVKPSSLMEARNQPHVFLLRFLSFSWKGITKHKTKILEGMKGSTLFGSR